LDDITCDVVAGEDDFGDVDAIEEDKVGEVDDDWAARR
jgi:hypothetical protein